MTADVQRVVQDWLERPGATTAELAADVQRLIAAALAEERAKVRAPFLALAVLLDGAAITASSREHRAFVPGTEAARAKAYRDAAGRIRRAAEETE